MFNIILCTGQSNSDYLIPHVQGEILVRFKNDVEIKTMIRDGNVEVGIASVDRILRTYRVIGQSVLFPEAKKSKAPTQIVAYNGAIFNVPNLHNIYKFALGDENQEIDILRELRNDIHVEYAELNLVYNLGEMVYNQNPLINSSEMSEDQLANVVNDPLYPQQNYISTVKANLVWDSVSADTSEVIAIIDTGIDWLHPDLANRIWINSDEIPANNFDDDGNGLIDDVRGWDWVNNDPNPMDDNNHGTHVAGIAGAERNNGIGIAGISQARLMPLKVFTNAGYADAATIIQAILYAANNGATIINMSFGSYARSLSMEAALMYAFLNCDLVASAGNDQECIYQSSIIDLVASTYPAALPYVLGVQAEAAFSNYDPDGPIFSLSEEGFNYELRAPGSDLLSTARNGTYKNMSGTSMAAPVVSGSIALYKAFHPDRSREEMWADLINNSSYYIDIKESCVNEVKHPVLNLVEYHIFDTLAGGDGDGQPDAGEQIQLWIKIKNTFGYADSVYALIRPTNTGDTTDVTILADSSYFGNISTFGYLTNEYIPFIIQINPDAGNNRNIELEVVMANQSDTSKFTSIVSFRIYNGQELSGILSQDKTLTPDKFWIINNSLRISTDVTLTILPGTTVEINAGVDNRGYVHAVGTQDSLINLLGIINGNTRLEYANVNVRGNSLSTNNIIKNSEVYNAYQIIAQKIINSHIHDIGMGNNGITSDSIISSTIENSFLIAAFQFNAQRSVFRNIILDNSPVVRILSSYYCVYDKLKSIHVLFYPTHPSAWTIDFLSSITQESQHYLINNSFLSLQTNTCIGFTQGAEDLINFPNQYWGTTDSLKIKDKNYDFWNGAGLPFLDTSPILTSPSDSCPGHVWKIMINNLDAQDDFKEPLGVGVHKFEVYFNRSMDINYTPALTFGLSFPYVQEVINDSASWSSDHKIWTAYKNIKIFTGDGLNRLRVDNARDMNGMKIPLEDDRFEFNIQAAGSSSIDFMATPGLGKINLEWNNTGVEDLLGFNMYRFQKITDTTFTSPVLINTTLITDTVYTDFNVLPNVRYYYYYRVLRTDFAESDSSKVISAIPLTASIGDANGDLTVNVLDITTIVAYLLSNNPQPFIYDAADVNSDETINVLDIVGLVNLVMGNSKSGSNSAHEMAYLYIENDTLFADIPMALGGIQVEFGGINMGDITVLNTLKGFESGNCMMGNKLRLLFYSMSGKNIEAGKRVPLLKFGKAAWIDNMVFADTRGGAVSVEQSKGNTSIPGEIAVLGQNYPNPFTGETVIPITIYQPVDEAVIKIYNIYGQLVSTRILSKPLAGVNSVKFSSIKSKGLLTYILEVKAEGQVIRCAGKKMANQ